MIASRTESKIELVAIDAAGRFFVRPQLSKADFLTQIHRDDSGIEWNDEMRALCAAEPHRWEHLALFRQIRGAVKRKYGRDFVLTPSTVWENVPADLRSQIEASMAQSPSHFDPRPYRW
jgi:hypothetical protein